MKRIIRLSELILTVLFMLISPYAGAQTDPGVWNVPRTGGDAITEPSPEATAMRRYQDYPVSHVTGTADISIPLLALQNGDLEVAIGLRYHTGGIKKTDIATSVGLGWSLTGLGSISRQINGFPDEWRGYGPQDNVDFDLRITSGVDVDYLRAILEAKKDTEYDCYNYNFAGLSGSFYIVDGNVVEYPPSEFIITPYRNNPDNSLEITSFDIYSPDGMVYTFEEKEYIEAKSYSTTITIPLIVRDYKAVSQWNLTKISSTLEKDAVTISYTSKKEWTRTSDKMLSGYSFYCNVCERVLHASETNPGGLNLDERTRFINHSIPSRISTSTGSIEFTTRKTTITPHLGAPADFISGITLKDADGKVIREVTLDNTTAFIDGRQKLSGVDVFSDGVLIDRYRLSYNDMAGDSGYDYFGYPNGKSYGFGYSHSVMTYDLELSSDRQPVPQYLADNCLTEISTITGLKTSIQYEPSTVNITPQREESVFSGNIIVGSRIKNIKTTDTVTGRIRNRTYEYYDPVCNIPLGSLIYSDFISQSGVHSFYGELTRTSTYSLGITFLPSASLRGVPTDNAQLYYGKVIEKLSGTDIDMPVVTEFEHDLSDVQSRLMLVGRSITDYMPDLGDNPVDGKSLGSLQNDAAGQTSYERKLLKPVASRGYLSQTFGGGPLLKRRTEKEWTSSGYRINSTEESYYSKTDRRTFTNALYCESVVFRYRYLNGDGTLNVTDYDDINYFYSEITAYRTVCDSTVRTDYYPDGSRRRVKTTYINTANSGNGGKFPGFNTDSVTANAGVAFSPMGVTVSCGDESISSYTARTENVQTEECFNVWMAGLRKLPVLEKWIVRTSEGSDSVLRQTDYGMFGSKSYVRPSSVLVCTAERNAADRAKISLQKYASYDTGGRIADMTDASGRRINAQWDARYDLLTRMTLPDGGLSTAYTHIPLVGCTSITSPSGRKRQFGYEAGRLVSEKNTAGLQVASYSYSLFCQQATGGRNLISSTVHDDSGTADDAVLYDGFGMAVRTLSTVAADKQALLTVDYDALDRPVRQYLPVPATEIDDAADAASYYGDANPYSLISYRNLASDKPVSVISEGRLMQQHPARTEYLCNSTANAQLRCRRLRLVSGADTEKITSDGYYPAGALDVVRATDPDGHVALLFTDWRGFRILERRLLDSSTFADTYFLYDPMGRLRVAVQPEGAALMTAANGSWDNNSDVLTKYAFINRYDRRGNCVSSLVPGGGVVEMRYDGYNRLAFRSTADMAEDGKTEFTLYDRIGRVVVSGIADCDISDIDKCYDMTASFSASAVGIDSTGYQIQDAGLSALVGNALVTIANYYDNYNVATRAGFSSLPLDRMSPQRAKGLLTATRQAIFSSSYGEIGARAEYQYSIFGYDSEERQVASVSSAVMAGELRTTDIQYSRLGHVDRTTESVVLPDSTYTLTIVNTHDARGNITKSVASVGSGQSEIEYAYDALGLMNRMSLHRQAGSRCEYSHDMRGRLKTIATPGFSQELYYEDGDTPCYNGSISAEDYGYETDAYTGLAWPTDKVTYSYDALNRLVGSASSDGYDTSYSYDLNSAITAIVRKGLLSDRVTKGVVDDLTMTYDGNRLSEVDDAADRVTLESSLDYDGRSSEPFAYDASGRLIFYPGTDELSIKYAPNDMPVQMSSETATADYRYLADGRKLSRTLTASLTLSRSIKKRTTTCDVGAFRFTRGGTVGSPKLDRVTLPWGYFDKKLQANVYIKDYQGNIRAVYNQYSTAIVQQTDYYPYGTGDIIKEGQQIGSIGKTGLENTDYGEHLHYELKINGKNINPAIDSQHLIDPQKLLPPSGPLFDVHHLDELVVEGKATKPAAYTNPIQLTIELKKPPTRIIDHGH